MINGCTTALLGGVPDQQTGVQTATLLNSPYVVLHRRGRHVPHFSEQMLIDLIFNGGTERCMVYVDDEANKTELDEITKDSAVSHDCVESTVDELDSRRGARQTLIEERGWMAGQVLKVG